MYDIITVGSATFDCFLNTGEQLFKDSKHRHGECVLVPFGTKIVISSITYSTGGGGTNTAVSFARLGLKTAMLGKFGGDHSNKVKQEFDREGVSKDLIIPGISTGFSVVLDAEGHDRTILTYRGSNDELSFSEIPVKKLRSNWFYFASMVGKSLDTLIKLGVYVKSKGAKIAFNPSAYIAKLGIKKLEKLLRVTDVLVFNFEEACLLLGKNEKEISVENAAIALQKYIAQDGIVVITNGSKGCHCLAKNSLYFIQPHKIKPVETTGAGDAFTSTFVAGLIMGRSIETSLQMGLANAQSVIMAPGAKNILLSKKEVDKRIKNNPAKIKISKL